MARPAAYDAAIDEILGVRPPAASTPVTPAPGTTDPMERGFRGWYEGYAKRHGLNPDPDDPQHHYDYRAAFQAGASPDKSGHWPSQFKREGHPNLVVDGKDTRTGQPAAARPQTYSGAIDEILGLPQDQELPKSLGEKILERVKEYLTERGGAAVRAAGDVIAQPTYGQKLFERKTGREPVLGRPRGPQTWEEYAYHLNPTPWALALGENVMRIPRAFGAGVAELGPEKAKPLTEEFAANAPFLFTGPKPKVPPAPPGPPRLALPGRTTPQLALPPFQPPGLTTRLPQGPLATPGGFGPVQGPQGVQPPLALPPAPLRLQPPSIGQEALDRLRTKFPGKRAAAATEDVPVHAIDATRGKTELLDQHGRPVVGEPGAMPERERLRTLYKGRLGASQLPENERLEGRMQEVVKEAGGHYQGIQYIKGRPQFVLFADDPQTGSTIYLPIDQATPQMVRQRLAAKAREMAAPPGPSPKEVERAYKASGMKPSGEEPPPTSSGEASLPKASPPGPSPAGPSPAGPSPAFTAPTATGSALQKSPFYEKTKIGQQAMIEGTQGRAIPTGKSQATGPQAGTEGTLFEKPTTAVQQPLEAPKPPVQRGQHYGSTVDTGTVRLTDPEELRIFLRQQGGLKPDSPGLDVQAAPKEFLSPKGRPFDELVQEVAEAQGLKPKDVERQINRTLSRYGTFRQEMKAEGLMTEIRAAAPPDDIKASIPLEEWRGMGPSDRRAAIEWYRDVFADTERETGMPPIGGGSGAPLHVKPTNPFRDETGALNLDKVVEGWKKFRRRLPMEPAVRAAIPDSPVISEVERWNVGLADGLKILTKTPWWKAIRKMNPETIKDVEERMVADWLAQIPAPIRQRMQDPKITLSAQEIAVLQQARAQAISRNAPPELQQAMQHRAAQFQRENQSRGFFGLQPIPEEYGPYIPRRTEKEAREAVSLGGGQLGVGRGLQTTVRGHGQERVFQTYRQGEAAGVEYEDPRNNLLMREWEGLKLRSTHRLFQNMEQKGALHRDRATATAATPPGQRTWRVENAPGGEWWTRSEAEARFLEQNLTESSKGPTGTFVHYGNMLVRNPSLVNPAPHIVKNMWMKALLADGPVGASRMVPDAVEYFRKSNPALLREFQDAMPFSSSGTTAGEILGNELRRSPTGEVVRGAIRGLGLVNKPSSKVIFEWADPAMRYSLFKHYREQGLTPYAAANHAWEDLIRYGTRSDLIDFWKSIPMNFFVPWRYGTLSALVKQVKNHPVRTALTLGAVDYLREMRYRESGKWTHVPWDYVENPIAIVLQNAIDGEKGAARQVTESLGIAATTRIFGPGGAFSAGQLIDTLKDIQGKGDWERTKNMFWGISQLYNLHHEYEAFQQTGDVKYLAEMIPTVLLGEHQTTSYQPRRLMRDLPEWLPGMSRSTKVEDIEQAQAQRNEHARRLEERRAQHPRKGLEEKLRERGVIP